MIDSNVRKIIDELWHGVENQMSIDNKHREKLWLAEYQRLEAMPKDKLIRMIIGDRPC